MYGLKDYLVVSHLQPSANKRQRWFSLLAVGCINCGSVWRCFMHPDNARRPAAESLYRREVVLGGQLLKKDFVSWHRARSTSRHLFLVGNTVLRRKCRQHALTTKCYSCLACCCAKERSVLGLRPGAGERIKRERRRSCERDIRGGTD